MGGYVTLVEWHKRTIKSWQESLGLSDYAVLWIAFLKGIFLTLLVVWLSTSAT